MSSGIFSNISGYHNRRSIRLRGFDYSQPGAYFVTLCAQDRVLKSFGDIVDGNMALNESGNLLRHFWINLQGYFSHVRLDEFVIMPNHMHGIIVIGDNVGAGSSRPASDGSSRPASDGSSRPASDGSSRPENKTPPTPLGESSVEGFTTTDNGAPGSPRQNVPPINNDNGGDKSTGRGDRAPTLGKIIAYFKYQTTKQINEIRQTGVQKIWQRNYFEHIIRDEKSLYLIQKYIRENPKKWTDRSENHIQEEERDFDNVIYYNK